MSKQNKQLCLKKYSLLPIIFFITTKKSN